MHRLEIKQLDGSFEHTDIISDDDLVEGQVVLDECLSLVDDDTATGWVERCEDILFGQVDGQFYKLLMQFLHCLACILCE